MLSTTVTREKGKLEKETWLFRLLDDGKIVLSEYQRWTRASLRHKWRAKGAGYVSYVTGGSSLRDVDVPWDETIVLEAKLGITSQLWIGRHSDERQHVSR